MARYVDEASTQYRNSTWKSAQLDSLACTTVAAPVPISTQGCNVGASTMANHGDMLSTCSCHLGGFFGGLGRLLARMCRIAIQTRTAPRTIFTASDASDGAVAGLGGLLPVAVTESVTTMASDTSQPKVKAAPLTVPRLEGSTIRNAVSGSGSSVTARPINIRLRITAAPVLLAGHGDAHLGFGVGDEVPGQVDGDGVQRAGELEGRLVVRGDR